MASLALVIVWAFEATPEGIKRTEVAAAAGQRSRGGAWVYIVLIGAALSVGLFFLGRYTAPPFYPLNYWDTFNLWMSRQ